MKDIHINFLTQTLDWANSDQVMFIIKCIYLIISVYFVFVVLSKAVKLSQGDANQDEIRRFYEAIQQNDTVSCIRLLRRYRECVNVFSSEGYTPFQYACAHGNTQLVKLMLENGADVHLKTKKQESPFYLAAFHCVQNPHSKNAMCIRELYYAGAKIDEPNGRNRTPLQMAAWFGHAPLVKWLLLKGASTRVVPYPYLMACSQGHQETAKVIWKMTKGVCIDFK